MQCGIADLAVANLCNMQDIEAGREIIREIASHIPVRPGADGVPVAQVSLNEGLPLGLAVGTDMGVVAGARFATHFQPRGDESD